MSLQRDAFERSTIVGQLGARISLSAYNKAGSTGSRGTAMPIFDRAAPQRIRIRWLLHRWSPLIKVARCMAEARSAGSGRPILGDRHVSNYPPNILIFAPSVYHFVFVIVASCHIQDFNVICSVHFAPPTESQKDGISAGDE